MNISKKILILGVTGMLGSTVFREFFNKSNHQVYGTMRSGEKLQYFSVSMHDHLICNIDALDHDRLVSVFARIKPDIVINCVGVIKQHSISNDPLQVLPINAMFPHRLSKLCLLANARLVHISTDCVFNGKKGMYTEKDVSNAEDLYGKSKYIGELDKESLAVTLRTSIIGHELNGESSLVDWFLSQEGSVNGFSEAVFSGLPTVELSRVILDFVIPNTNIRGVYHVSVDPINKFSLLKLIAEIYGKNIEIKKSNQLVIDRSLDSTLFRELSGYTPPVWKELIKKMYISQER